MLDIQYIRENHKKVKQAASNKNVSVDIDELLTLDEKRRALLQQIEKLRKARNETAAQMKKGALRPLDCPLQWPYWQRIGAAGAAAWAVK